MNKIISDISDYIFVADNPQKVDAIFLPGGSFPEMPEYAAELFHKGYVRFLIPSGGISIKQDKWQGVSSKAEIYTENYNSEFEFFTGVLIKNGITREARAIGDGMSYLLVDVVVDSKYQKKGIGKKLVNSIIDEIKGNTIAGGILLLT